MANTDNRADKAVEDYAKLVAERGMSEKDLYNRQNLYSPAALMMARSLNSESKDSLGIAASFNKGVSMLATVGAKLKAPAGKLYTSTGVITADRIVDNAVQLVGGSIGLFADAPKNPYPGPLHLNTITTPIMNTMFALGFPKRAAIMFQSLPIIVDLVSDYNQNYSSAYKASNARKISFGKFMNIQYNELFQSLLPALEELDLIVKNENDVAFLDKNSYKVIWTNSVSPGDNIENFGFDVTTAEGKPLPEAVKSLILMNEFRDYSAVANNISFKITKLTDTLKGLKPDMETFDKLFNTYKEAYKGSSAIMFTNETMDKLFTQYPVLESSYNALEYMDKMSKSIFLERTSFVKGLTNLLTSNIFGYDGTELKKDLKAFIALQLQKSSMESNPVGYFPEMYLNLLNPTNFLSADILADYEELKRRYPNNAFVKQLTIRNVGDVSQGMRVLEMVSSKLNKNQKDNVLSDFTALIRDNVDVKQRAWRLAYYGMIKSGAKKARGGYFELLPAGISKNMSAALSTLKDDLVALDKIVAKQKQQDVKFDEDNNPIIDASIKREYIKKMDELFNKNFNGSTLEDIITEAISKVVSIHLMGSPEFDYKKVMSVAKTNEITRSIATQQNLIDFVKKAVGEEGSKNIITDKGTLPVVGLSIDSKYKLKVGEIDLFVPTGTTLKISLSSNMNDIEKAFLVSSSIRTSGDKFIFPVYKKNIYGQMLVLKKIDNKSIGEAFIDSLYESGLSNTGQANITGLEAEYEVVPEQGATNISPLAFGMNEGATIKNMTSLKIMQLSSVRSERMPSTMRIVSAENRMYEVKDKQQPVTNHLNKTYVRDDNSKVSISNKFTAISYLRDKVYLQPMNQGNGAVYNELDILAQKLGRSTWEVLKADPEFEDFFAGKSKIYLYQLENNDNLSTSTKSQTESGNITDKDIDDTLDDKTCNGGK
jgi:hypothetical protein